MDVCVGRVAAARAGWWAAPPGRCGVDFFFFLDLSSLSSQAEEEREIEVVPPFVCSSP